MSPRRKPAVSSQSFFIIVIIVITFIIVISYYGKPCPTGVHRWQGGVTMVNKVLVAMETLFCSNRLVQMFEFWIAVPPHHLVCITCRFSCVLIFFLEFCIFILIRCTVCGCILRLLVPFKIVSLTLKHVVRTHNVLSHSYSNRKQTFYTWRLTNGFCGDEADQWRASYCPRRVGSVRGCLCDRLSSLLCPSPLVLSWEEGGIAQCIHGCSVAIVCFINLGDDRGPTEYFKDGTEKLHSNL